MPNETEYVQLVARLSDNLMSKLVCAALDRTEWAEDARPDVRSARQRLRVYECTVILAVGMHYHDYMAAASPPTISDSAQRKMLKSIFDTLFSDVWNAMKTWPGCTGPDRDVSGAGETSLNEQ